MEEKIKSSVAIKGVLQDLVPDDSFIQKARSERSLVLDRSISTPVLPKRMTAQWKTMKSYDGEIDSIALTVLTELGDEVGNMTFMQSVGYPSHFYLYNRIVHEHMLPEVPGLRRAFADEMLQATEKLVAKFFPYGKRNMVLEISASQPAVIKFAERNEYRFELAADKQIWDLYFKSYSDMLSSPEGSGKRARYKAFGVLGRFMVVDRGLTSVTHEMSPSVIDIDLLQEFCTRSNPSLAGALYITAQRLLQHYDDSMSLPAEDLWKHSGHEWEIYNVEWEYSLIREKAHQVHTARHPFMLSALLTKPLAGPADDGNGKK